MVAALKSKDKIEAKQLLKNYSLSLESFSVCRVVINAPHPCDGCTPPQVILLNLRIIPIKKPHPFGWGFFMLVKKVDSNPSKCNADERRPLRLDAAEP